MLKTNDRGFTLDLSRGIFAGENLDSQALKSLYVIVVFYCLIIGALVTMALKGELYLAPWLLLLFFRKRK
jgi:hypothetical protein